MMEKTFSPPRSQRSRQEILGDAPIGLFTGIAAPSPTVYLPPMPKNRSLCSFPAIAPVACALFLAQAAQAQSFTGLPLRADLEGLDANCFLAPPSPGCSGWTGIRNAGTITLSGEKTHTGKSALRIEFLKNEDYGGAYRKTEGRHIFTRFYDYYDVGFDFAAGMKIHRLTSFNEARQLNDYDIILQLKAEEPGANYCGPTDAKWIALTYNGGPVDWGSVEARFTPARGRWYSIETEVKLNTPGLSDGEARLWIDGRIVAEKRGMNLVGAITAPINNVMFGGWYSNAAAGKNPCPDPVAPSRRYVDDAAIAGAYIGPVAGGSTPDPIPPRKPPRRPRNLPAHEYDPIPD